MRDRKQLKKLKRTKLIKKIDNIRRNNLPQPKRRNNTLPTNTLPTNTLPPDADYNNHIPR